MRWIGDKPYQLKSKADKIAIDNLPGHPLSSVLSVQSGSVLHHREFSMQSPLSQVKKPSPQLPGTGVIVGRGEDWNRNKQSTTSGFVYKTTSFVRQQSCESAAEIKRKINKKEQ